MTKKHMMSLYIAIVGLLAFLLCQLYNWIFSQGNMIDWIIVLPYLHAAQFVVIFLFTMVYLKPRLSLWWAGSVPLRLLAVCAMVGCSIMIAELIFSTLVPSIAFSVSYYFALQILSILLLPILFFIFVIRKKRFRSVIMQSVWSFGGTIVVYGMSCYYAFKNLRRFFVFLRVDRLDLFVKKAEVLFPEPNATILYVLKNMCVTAADWLSTWLLNPKLQAGISLGHFFDEVIPYCLMAFFCICLFTETSDTRDKNNSCRVYPVTFDK